MKFLTITLIVHAPHPITGAAKPTTDRFREVIENALRYHEQFGHTVLHLHADAGGLTDAQHREALELFQSDIAPVLRRDIPDPPWPGEATTEPTFADSTT